VDEQTAGAGTRPTSRLVVDVVRALRGWVVAAAGGVLLLGCYLGVSKETDVAFQLPYVVSGGFGGLALVLIGSALLVADRIDASQATQKRLASQIDDLHTLIIAAAANGAASGSPAEHTANHAAVTDADATVSGPTGQRY